ncbi:MAG: right-handed parallel beta-helix repeat-containing protein [Sedimentisphaerales bacterium]
MAIAFLLKPIKGQAATLSIIATNGSVTATPAKVDYSIGEIVELIPKPHTGYYFTGWAGDAHGKKLVLNLTMSSDKTVIAKFATWKPPIGIPVPGFGIFENYRMYDDPANRNQTLTYTQNSEGGYYTHYIDNTDPGATDTSNPYGTASLPRITIPTNLVEGSVVEIHGGPYTYGTYIWRLSGQGTANKPIFVRGWDPNDQNNFPVIQGKDIRHSGSYMILENLNLLDTMIIFYPGDSVYDHMTIRNNLIHDQLSPTGSVIALGDPRQVNPTFDHTVIYNNHIYNNGMPRDQYDAHGIAIMDYATNVWIVDNHIHDNDGDSIQVNAAAGQAAVNGEHPQYIYIGRNVMSHDTENAVDLKDSEHVIISENTMYGYRALFDSDGTACLPGNEGGRLTWVLCNDIYDSVNAIRIDDEVLSNTTYIIGNTLHDTLAHGIVTYRKMTIYVINNVLYNIPGSGFVSWVSQNTTVGSTQDSDYSFFNNIFSEIGTFEIEIENWGPMAALADRTPIENNLFHRSSGTIAIKWADATYYSLADFINNEPGKGVGCIEADPLFMDAANADFSLQASSPAIDAGASSGAVQQAFTTFEQLYGIDIRKDTSGNLRPQGSEWDIGAHEYTLSEVTDLAILDASQNSVTIGWTVPGGDGSSDRPGRYDIRYATSSLAEANWDAATQVQGEPTPGNFGDSQSFAITGLNSGATYYVGIKTSNDTGSTTSQLSNVVPGTTTTSGNHAPVFQAIGDRSIAENGTLTFVVSATDADPGDTLSYSATDVPTGGSFDPNTRTFVWTPSSGENGTYHVTFHVSDGQVSVSETITITVTVGAPIQQTLTVSSTSGGSVTGPGEGVFRYDHGTVVSIQGTAVTSYHFVNWTGTAVNAGKVTDPNAASTTVTVDGDYTIQANFAIDPRTLTFSSTSGGSVTVPGEGIFQYAYGTSVAIRATPLSNYYFVNWTGTAVNAGKVANPNAASTTVTADVDYTVIANFGQQDGAAPTVTGLSPAADDIQVPLNSLIILHITDTGLGVDAGSVTIALDGNTVYTGDTTSYNSASGHCYRVGTPADYTYVYQSNQNFDFDQTLTVTVNAADLSGVAMVGQSHSFTTEMRSFGQNNRVDPGIEGIDKAGPATARDSAGNMWAVWHAGPVGSRDIFIARLDVGAEAFGASVRLTTNSSDQSNPAIAVDANDRLYVVWQDNRQAGGNNLGEWDIYCITSSDGVNWSPERRVNDPNEGNQLNPAIVIDSQSSNYAHVVWQDDYAGNQDICMASSSDGFATETVSQITNDPSNQTEPAIAVDSSSTIYVLWTDTRNPTNGLDIYGAASSTGPWTNVPVVSKVADQASSAIAVESTGSILHMLWTDQTSGDSGIYYASSNGLPGSALIGSNLIDDYAKGKGQFSPAIAVTGSTGNSLGVFACWHDERDVSGSVGDTDIWFVQANSGSETNVFVGDGGTNSNQTEPAIGIDQYGYPYVVWTDDRGDNSEIYSAASTYMKPTSLASGQVSPTSTDVTVGTDPASIVNPSDASIVVLAGTCPYDVNMTITEIENLPGDAHKYVLNGYDFGPSGITFNIPVTMTIPYTVTAAAGTPTVYWYDSRTGTLSQQGITNIETIEITSNLHALQFKTTHLTPFFTVLGLPTGGGGGGGGGCALSRSQDESFIEYFLPYAALVFVVFLFKRKDRKTQSTLKRLS